MEPALWYRLEETQGEPLYLPWADLNGIVSLKRGEMLVVGGMASGGKSILATNLVAALRLPALYFAQDQPDQIYTFLAGLFLEEDTRDLYKDQEQRARLRECKDFQHVFINRSSISLEEMGYYVEAYYELMGFYPSLLIIDNLLNMTAGDSSYVDLSFYAKLLPRLRQFASDYGILLVVLHHTKRTEPTDRAGKPTPPNINSLLYSGEKEADHVWYVRLDKQMSLDPEEQKYTVFVLKQRMGRADPYGNLSIDLSWNAVTKKLENRIVQPAGYDYWEES